VTTVEMAVPTSRRGLKLLSDMVIAPKLLFAKLLELQSMIAEVRGCISLDPAIDETAPETEAPQ